MKKNIKKMVPWSTRLCLGLLLIHSCTKKSDYCEFYPMDPALTKGSGFSMGSYFVYRDSNTLNIDSFWVYAQSRDSFCDGNSSNSQYDLRYSMMNSANLTISCRANRSAMYGTVGSFENACFLHTYFAENSILTSPSDANIFYELNRKYDSIQIVDSIYETVYEVTSKRLSADKSDTSVVIRSIHPKKDC